MVSFVVRLSNHELTLRNNFLANDSSLTKYNSAHELSRRYRIIQVQLTNAYSDPS